MGGLPVRRGQRREFSPGEPIYLINDPSDVWEACAFYFWAQKLWFLCPVIRQNRPSASTSLNFVAGVEYSVIKDATVARDSFDGRTYFARVRVLGFGSV
jgi:hypothetical protein